MEMEFADFDLATSLREGQSSTILLTVSIQTRWGKMIHEQAGGYRILDLESNDRPRERLELLGAEALNNAELLAILLRMGIPGENAVQLGQRLLQEFHGSPGLQRASFVDVCAVKGLGLAKAAQIKAAIELGRRLAAQSVEDRPAVHSPADAAELVRYEMAALPQEQLWVLVLDTRNRVLGIEKVYKGSLNSSMVRIGELFRPAIQRNAASIIVVHNHPSGDPTPSGQDIDVTRQVVDAGRALNISVHDHLVVGREGVASFKALGLFR